MKMVPKVTTTILSKCYGLIMIVLSIQNGYLALDQITIEIHWWTNEPYIFSSNGTIMGMIPSLFKNISSRSSCKSEAIVNYSNDYISYTNLKRKINEDYPKNFSGKGNHVVYFYGPVYTMSDARIYNHIAVSTSTGVTLVYWAIVSNKLYRAFGVGLNNCILLLIIAVLGVAIFGILMWIAEHRKNPEDIQKNFFLGSLDGIYLAVITLSTVGYGDKAAKTLIGMLLTSFWILCSMVLVSTLTALVTSGLSETELSFEGRKITYLNEDLKIPSLIEGERAIPVGCANHQEAFRRVASLEAFGAMVDTNTVAAMQDVLWDDFIVVGKTYPVNYRPYMLIKMDQWIAHQYFWQCIERLAQHRLPKQLKKNLQPSLYRSVVTMNRGGIPVIPVLVGILGTLLTAGSLYQMKMFIKSKDEKQKTNSIDHADKGMERVSCQLSSMK